MNHRATTLAVCIPLALFAAVQRWPGLVSDAAGALRATLAFVL